MMGGYPSQPGLGQNLAALWGGQGFGGIGSPGAVPQVNPGGALGGQDLANTFGYAAPGTTGGPQRTMGASQPPPPPDIWSRLMNAIGQGGLSNIKMPGTTIGAPAGQTPVAPPVAPMLPQTQMPRPPGMGAYFQALQNPTAPSGNNNALLAQYMALQQLMRST